MRKWIQIVFIFCVLLYALPATGQLFINEFMASNRSIKVDPDFFQYVDWIEIYNAGDQNVDIGDWYFKDNLARIEQWQIPLGTTITAGAYILFWADGTDTVAQGYHTDFKLSAQGEDIGLYNTNDVLVDYIVYGDQGPDISFGRRPDGHSDWVYFMVPTPGRANDSVGVQEFTFSPSPIFSHASGFYNGAQSIVLTVDSSDAVIRFTQDGSIPNLNSTAYTSPLSISSITVVRAKAFVPGALPSETVTCTYFIDEQFQLPVVSLTTAPGNLWNDEYGIYLDEDVLLRKEWERPVCVEFFESDGSPGFVAEADIRLFGRSAIYLPQKSLGVFLEERLAYPLFQDREIDGYNSFILRSSSDDWHLTLFRDAMMQTLLKNYFIIDRQAYQPSILFLNGAYWGIHNIREKYNEDYITDYHGMTPNNIDLLYVDYRDRFVDILTGDADHYLHLLDYINNNDLSLQDHYEHVSTLIDIDNFIDYIIPQIFFANWSWSHNVRMWRPKTASGKWQWLIFDLDRGFTELDMNLIEELKNQLPVFQGLMENEKFREKIIRRFDVHLNTAFRSERMISTIDSIKQLLEPAMPRHIQRWDYTEGSDYRGIQSMIQWDGNVNNMITFANQRQSYQRQHLQMEFGISGTANISLHISSGGGHVIINDGIVVKEDFSGTFFKDIPIVLEAIPVDGYRFIGWDDHSETTVAIINCGTEWKYLDDGSNPDDSWTGLEYDDSGWASGFAELGYGDGDEATVVNYGPDVNNKFVTTYFRKTFMLGESDAYLGFVYSLLRDDGAVVYLNGQEVGRFNMPSGPIDYQTYANSTIDDNVEKTFVQSSVDIDLFVTGENVLAVEIHQYSPTSSDISFDLGLEGFLKKEVNGNPSTETTIALSLTKDTTITALFDINPDNVLSGEITEDRILSLQNSPYIAQGDVIVHPYTTLTVEPGVVIRMPASAQFIIQGRLLLNGSENQPISIQAKGESARWGALCFIYSTDPSFLNYVHLDGGSVGREPLKHRGTISIDHADVSLNHVIMTSVLQPIYSEDGNIIIRNSTIDGTGTSDDIINIVSGSASVENSDLYGDGEIDFDAVDNGVIRGNRITISSADPNRDGIDIGLSKNVVIQDNRIMNCPDKGISIGELSTATLQRNVLVNCNLGIAVKDGSSALIDHNTFYGNSTAVTCYEKNEGMGGGNAIVTNCILSKSAEADYTVDQYSSLSISFSLSDRDVLAGERNLFTDPLFIAPDENNFRLRSNSPCINAGDPNSPPDPDGTRTDMGAFYYHMASLEGAPIFINEFLAINNSNIVDETGEFEDWIEIYNGAETAVDVGGLYITDDFIFPTKWQIPLTHPELTTILPDSFLVLWADRDIDQGIIHLGVKISGSGEELGLVQVNAMDTVFIDSIRFGVQHPDISFGRFPDGGDRWTLFHTPTPGATNNASDPFPIRLLSPPNDTTIQSPAGRDVSLQFTWTSWQSLFPSDSFRGYHFQLTDHSHNTFADTLVSDTLLNLTFIPDFTDHYHWFVLSKEQSGTITLSDTFNIHFEQITSIANHQRIPERFAMHQNVPNPFNRSTQIRFDLPKQGRVHLVIYDMMGRKVRLLKDDILPAGFHHVVWNGADENGSSVSTGIYFIKILIDGGAITRKIILIK